MQQELCNISTQIYAKEFKENNISIRNQEKIENNNIKEEINI